MGYTRGQTLIPTHVYEYKVLVDLWTLVLPISRHFTLANYTFFEPMLQTINNLISAYFHWNRINWKIWPHTKVNDISIIFFFIPITQHRTDIMYDWFFYSLQHEEQYDMYNNWNWSIFNFSHTWRGSLCHH